MVALVFRDARERVDHIVALRDVVRRVVHKGGHWQHLSATATKPEYTDTVNKHSLDKQERRVNHKRNHNINTHADAMNVKEH